MPSGEELEQLLERMEDHLDPWEISRLHQMADATANDHGGEVEDGHAQPAPEVAR